MSKALTHDDLLRAELARVSVFYYAGHRTSMLVVDPSWDVRVLASGAVIREISPQDARRQGSFVRPEPRPFFRSIQEAETYGFAAEKARRLRELGQELAFALDVSTLDSLIAGIKATQAKQLEDLSARPAPGPRLMPSP